MSCFWCGNRETRLTRDHIIPKAIGGLDGFENIVWACEKCNNERGTVLTYHYLMKRLIAKKKTRTNQEYVTRLIKRYNDITYPIAVRLRNKWIEIEYEKLGHSPTKDFEIRRIY